MLLLFSRITFTLLFLCVIISAEFLTPEQCDIQQLERCAPQLAWTLLRDAQYGGCATPDKKAPSDCRTFEGYPGCVDACNHGTIEPRRCGNNTSPPWFVSYDVLPGGFDECMPVVVGRGRLMVGYSGIVVHVLRIVRALLWHYLLPRYTSVLYPWLLWVDVGASVVLWVVMLLLDWPALYATWPIHMVGLSLLGCSIVLASAVGERLGMPPSRVQLGRGLGYSAYLVGMVFYAVMLVRTAAHRPTDSTDIYALFLSVLLVLFCMVTLCVLLCAKKLLGQFGIVASMSAFALMNAVMVQVAVGIITYLPPSASYASFMLWVMLGVELAHSLLLVLATFQGHSITKVTTK